MYTFIYVYICICTGVYIYIWMVVSNIFCFHPEPWGRFSPILTFAYVSKGLVKNHQPDIYLLNKLKNDSQQRATPKDGGEVFNSYVYRNGTHDDYSHIHVWIMYGIFTYTCCEFVLSCINEGKYTIHE